MYSTEFSKELITILMAGSVIFQHQVILPKKEIYKYTVVEENVLLQAVEYKTLILTLNTPRIITQLFLSEYIILVTLLVRSTLN